MPTVNLKDFDFNIPTKPLDMSPDAAAWAKQQHKIRVENTAHQNLIERRLKLEIENGAISPIPVGLMALISDLIKENPLKDLPVPLAFQREAPVEWGLPADCRSVVYCPTRAWTIVDRDDLTEKCKPIVNFIDLSEECRRRLSEKMILFWNRSVRMEEEIKRIRTLEDPLITRMELHKARQFAKEKEDEAKAAKAELIMYSEVCQQIYEQFKETEARHLEREKQRIKDLDEIHQEQQKLALRHAELEELQASVIQGAEEASDRLKESRVDGPELWLEMPHLFYQLKTPALIPSLEEEKLHLDESETHRCEHGDMETDGWRSATLKTGEKQVRMGDITEFKTEYHGTWKKQFLDLLLVKGSARTIAEQPLLTQLRSAMVSPMASEQ